MAHGTLTTASATSDPIPCAGGLMALSALKHAVGTDPSFGGSVLTVKQRPQGTTVPFSSIGTSVDTRELSDEGSIIFTVAKGMELQVSLVGGDGASVPFHLDGAAGNASRR